MTEKQRRYREWYRKTKDEGRCVKCGQDAHGTTVCAACLMQQKLRQFDK